MQGTKRQAAARLTEILKTIRQDRYFELSASLVSHRLVISPWLRFGNAKDPRFH